MAPPRTSTVPLLSELDAAAIARDVCERALQHVERFVAPFSPGIEIHIVDPGGSRGVGTTLYYETEWLTVYAQRGLPVGDWTDHGCASDACVSVFSALYTSAGSPEVGGGIVDMAADVDPEDALGVMLLAAFARIKIDQRGRIAPRELAVLSGLSSKQVRRLIDAGEIRQAKPREGERGGEMFVAAGEATRWLSARAVPGFGGGS